MYLLVIQHSHGKSLINEGFNRKIIYKWAIYTMAMLKNQRVSIWWFPIYRATPSSPPFKSMDFLWWAINFGVPPWLWKPSFWPISLGWDSKEPAADGTSSPLFILCWLKSGWLKKMICVQAINGISSDPKMEVRKCTIFLAIFCGDIPSKIGLRNRPNIYGIGSSNVLSVPEMAMWDFFPWPIGYGIGMEMGYPLVNLQKTMENHGMYNDLMDFYNDSMGY